ncbi:unnamed protein product [Spirodela intermedia]|uniref:Plant heme peroxidase family profile domain-containing protein n=1 Tax=Spirodela intermedia TaxID=51605 RepID=A0A7I8LJK5_SPIIN|nr:unnamed protein product [Spirodela intermedia]
MAATRSVSSLSSFLLFLLLFVCTAHAQMRSNFYSSTCPNLHRIVQNAMRTAVRNDRRLLASMIRLFFHDCFVNAVTCFQQAALYA